MIRERHLNALVLALLLIVPLWALINDEPFTITLATRAVIFALAAVGLNIALGLGGACQKALACDRRSVG